MPGVSLSEKLAALSKRQEASGERSKLASIISELAGVLVSSNWRDVPDSTLCHDIVAPLRDFLRRQASKMDSDLVVQQLQLLMAPAEQAVAMRNDGVNVLQRYREQLIIWGNETLDAASKASVEATIASIIGEYSADAGFTKKVVKNTLGEQYEFQVGAMAALNAFDDSKTAAFLIDAVDQALKALVDDIASIQQKMAAVDAMLTSVVRDGEITAQEFERVKSHVSKQLNGKLLALSQSIEFYDVVAHA